jgi:hypothetical protein
VGELKQPLCNFSAFSMLQSLEELDVAAASVSVKRCVVELCSTGTDLSISRSLTVAEELLRVHVPLSGRGSK